ncbi:universal stress protein [Brucella sp. RRSP16]|uniref:universal stress protein n=1 Tax=Brucella sp. RRSP16 TaxID=3453707 RepID=UPI003FCE3DBB
MYKHILIATDGSNLADRCVEQGLALAKALDCDATVATVTAPYSSGGIFGGMFDDEAIVVKYDQSWKKRADKILHNAQDRARKIDLEVNVLHLVNPIPSDAILKAADSIGCDLIVVATHGYSGAQRLLLGSQANEIVTLGKKSVLIVR